MHASRQGDRERQVRRGAATELGGARKDKVIRYQHLQDEEVDQEYRVEQQALLRKASESKMSPQLGCWGNEITLLLYWIYVASASRHPRYSSLEVNIASYEDR